MNIPAIAMVDTNCDPALVDFPIPSNDDAIRAIKLVSGMMSEAVMQGRQEFLAQREGFEEEEMLATAGDMVQPAAVSAAPEAVFSASGEESLEPETDESESAPEGETKEVARVPARKPRTIRKRLTPRGR